MNRDDVELEAGEDLLDPLEGDPRVAAYFGGAFERIAAFAELLRAHGVERGLIGPREPSRLWERHLLNSASVLPYLPPGSVADVGSGAGLPGVVIAAMNPEREVVLVEPMERRTEWLEFVVHELELPRVRVVRGRAEDLAADLRVRVVTARAVAPITKLLTWCVPLLAPEGEMAFLKGRSAQTEADGARHALRRRGMTATVVEAPTLDGLEPTRVVTIRRQA